METLLAVSVESRSIRFAAYDGTSGCGELNLVGRGQVALVGADIEFVATSVRSSHPEIARTRSADGRFDHDAAAARILGWLGRQCGQTLTSLKAVGHRVALAGDDCPPSLPVTDQMLSDLAHRLSGSNAHALATMRYLGQRCPEVPQIACFSAADCPAALPMPAPGVGDGPREAGVSAGALKSIAAAALRAAEAAPVSAVIHLFPMPAPAVPQREPAEAVARCA